MNEFRYALYPMHRCHAFRNSYYDKWLLFPLPVMFGWRKNCPCRRMP